LLSTGSGEELMMFSTLRTKLLIGLTPLLVLMIGLGVWAIVMFSHLGGKIDVILRENYRSVVAAENMKEALERMDSSALFAISGRDDLARDQFARYRPIFEKNLKVEQNNVTLPGEQELADDLARLFGEYVTLFDRFYALPTGSNERVEMYFAKLLRTFDAIKNKADEVLRINQENMWEENDRARKAAADATRLMVVALLGTAAVATLAALALSKSILEPIQAVTRAARAMAKGDYDQVVPAMTHDELGELALAFNTMARRIREFQQAGTARLVRAQQTAQATIDSFPDPVVVVDPDGAVERANPAARRLLSLAHASNSVPWVAPAPVRPALKEVLGGRPDFLPTSLDHAICLRDEGQERFYLPRVLAIRSDDSLIGAAIVLQDVTKFRLVDQLKSDMVSTVSHELKTPLTSVQMAIHLLLEESVGPLTAKQIELLLAARQEGERLLTMVNDLLDLTRIEQGRVQLDLAPVAPADLVGEAVDRFEARARDAGVEFGASVSFGLPPVQVDRERIGHVFDNLITNALTHTERGDSIRLSAEPDGAFIRFQVSDTGEGISAEHLPRLFEKFFRVPGSRSRGGAGLGLAITREIILSHGGQIDVASRPGAGTTFTFLVPLATAGAALEPQGSVPA
jgi:signal transduction histidine kinase